MKKLNVKRAVIFLLAVCLSAIAMPDSPLFAEENSIEKMFKQFELNLKAATDGKKTPNPATALLKKLADIGDIEAQASEATARSMRLLDVTVKKNGETLGTIRELAVKDADIANLEKGMQDIGSLELHGADFKFASADRIVFENMRADLARMLDLDLRLMQSGDLSLLFKEYAAVYPPDFRIGKIHILNLRGSENGFETRIKSYEGQNVTATAAGPQKISEISVLKNGSTEAYIGELSLAGLKIPDPAGFVETVTALENRGAEFGDYLKAYDGLELKNFALSYLSFPPEQAALASAAFNLDVTQGVCNFAGNIKELKLPGAKIAMEGISPPQQLNISISSKGSAQGAGSVVRINDSLALSDPSLLDLEADLVVALDGLDNPKIEKLQLRTADKGINAALSPAVKLLLTVGADQLYSGFGNSLMQFFAGTNNSMSFNSEAAAGAVK